jgi:hypothetical protein
VIISNTIAINSSIPKMVEASNCPSFMLSIALSNSLRKECIDYLLFNGLMKSREVWVDIFTAADTG